MVKYTERGVDVRFKDFKSLYKMNSDSGVWSKVSDRVEFGVTTNNPTRRSEDLPSSRQKR